MYEARYRELDEFCQKLQVVAAQLTNAIDRLPQGGCTDACSHVSSSASPNQRLLPQQGKVSATTGTATDSGSNGHSQPRPSDADEQNTDQSQEQVNNSGEFGTQAFGSLVHDSYGALRFVGGANNEFLLQAVDSLTLEPCQGSDDSPYSVRSQQDTTKMIERPKPELPFFVHGLRWRDLPYLPKAEDVNLPPKYIANMLVGLYFEHFHYTFPVIYKPYFTESYKTLYTSQRGSIQDTGFVSIFFAVCACASSLTAPDGNHSSFPGLEFYEKALVLHYATTGQATKSRVQCLALISMCCAGWNTLSTSWNFSGQAIRAGQELGMHLEVAPSTTESPRSPAASVEVEIYRRIWWSIYCLDRITSICLGRPMAANDSDCYCALPLPLGDEELDTLYSVEGTLDHDMNQRSALSGFLDIIGLCKVAGEVQSIQSPGEIRDLGRKAGQKRVMDLALGQEKSLDSWLKDLLEHLQSYERYWNH
ncbi:transcriptional regulatory [Fusarium subglutinans]|uniref:Transcriptional regulatory n=1 Tax=Gibberella subglutinans TaxID=42677 RepID=A0A8H5UU57_GIBSU|nr:transcriptional regulatory [Fusarium subglutinans]KAF5597499.1 transcriptional regulatory [Fusarium subglutinans]